MGPVPLDAEFDSLSNGVGHVPAFKELGELWGKQAHNSKHVQPQGPNMEGWDLALPVGNQIPYLMVYTMCQLSRN